MKSESQTPSERKQCDFPCYTKFSDCMGKVSGAALTERICIVEKDKCLYQCEKVEKVNIDGEALCLKWETYKYVPCKDL